MMLEKGIPHRTPFTDPIPRKDDNSFGAFPVGPLHLLFAYSPLSHRMALAYRYGCESDEQLPKAAGWRWSRLMLY
jgi:hypothetical protein